MCRYRMSIIGSLIALQSIGIFFIDARAPQKLLSSMNAKPGELKYQVSLQWKNEHACGGALISENHVLTAAHCFWGDPPKTESFTVLTGTKSIVSDGEHHKIKYVTLHPDYVPGNPANRWRHDIAVITLETPAKKNEFQAPVALPSGDTTGKVTATLSGWGKLDTASTGFPNDLRKIYVTTLTQTECNATTVILDTHLCGYDGADTGFCYGDSGSPLVYKNEVIGIVSFGVSCGFGRPDVYTRVWSYRDFIKTAMRRV